MPVIPLPRNRQIYIIIPFQDPCLICMLPLQGQAFTWTKIYKNIQTKTAATQNEECITTSLANWQTLGIQLHYLSRLSYTAHHLGMYQRLYFYKTDSQGSLAWHDSDCFETHDIERIFYLVADRKVCINHPPKNENQTIWRASYNVNKYRCGI